MTESEVLVASDTTADFYPQEATDGSVGHAYRWVVGGTGTNVARGLAALGDPPYLATDVGNDSLGRAVREELAAHSVPRRLVREVDRPTPLALYVPADAGGPDWEIRLADSSYGFELTADAVGLFPDLSTVYLSGTTLPPSVALESVRTAVERAREHDVTVAFDLNGRGNLWDDPAEYTALVREVLADTDILFAGDDDLSLAGRASDLDGLRALLPTDADCLAYLTRGEEGATAARVEDGTVVDRATHRGFDVSTTDPAGAGDAFVAAVLGARGRGVESLPALLRAGNAAGAAAVTSVGPLRQADLETFHDLDGDVW